MLKPNEKSQMEMLIGGLTDVLFRAAENNEAVFCLPGGENCFEANAQYGIDGFTEKACSKKIRFCLMVKYTM